MTPMRYPFPKILLLIAVAVWAIGRRPFRFVLWTALVSAILFVLMYAFEKVVKERDRQVSIGTRRDGSVIDRPSAIDAARDAARSIL